VLPPLRERGDDILLIAKKFLTKYAKEENRSFRGFAPETETILRHYEWPGNVRELQNVIRNIVVLNDGQEVTAEMLPAPLNKLHKGHSRSKKASYQTTHAQTPAVVSPPSGLDTAAARRSKTILPLWQIEKETILHAIELCDGNVPKAAALLEVSPSTIYRKRQNWE